MADQTKSSASTVQSDRYEKSPAKVPGHRDEAKQLPDDVAVNVTGGPDADLHHPAAASSVADSEAGADGEPEGRIEPLQRKDPPTRRNGG
jgi:hypothetical protein